jgi:hypothetical protein
MTGERRRRREPAPEAEPADDQVQEGATGC